MATSSSKLAPAQNALSPALFRIITNVFSSVPKLVMALANWSRIMPGRELLAG